jgi:hypothetical protein
LGVSGKRRDLMGMPKAKVAALLVGLGFTLKSSSGFGEEYSFPLATGWKVTAYASFEGNAFAGTAKPDEFDEVSFTVDSKGTKHKCLSVSALKANAKKIIAELLRLSQHEDLLRCPKCGVRYVHAKEPLPGQKWKPFLSCEGMMIVGRGANKHVACDGVSKKIPAVVEYR